MTNVQPMKARLSPALFADLPWRAYLLLLPALSLVLVLFGGGLGLAFLQSVGLLGLTDDGGLSLAAYGEAERTRPPSIYGTRPTRARLHSERREALTIFTTSRGRR